MGDWQPAGGPPATRAAAGAGSGARPRPNPLRRTLPRCCTRRSQGHGLQEHRRQGAIQLRGPHSAGNLYFDAERYDDAIKWYQAALKLKPKDVNVSTDLGVCYYSTNQPDKALEQFNQSLKIDPNHAKTLLNIGIVKAFAKQDLDGALAAWEQVVRVAPDSPEGQQAKRGIEGIRSAHASGGAGQKPGN